MSTQIPSRPKPSRPSRQQMMFEFDMQRDAEESSSNRSYFIGAPYPPSLRSISELSQIDLSDLQLESHHRGKVLILRCIEQPIRSAAIQTLVEDSTGLADRLALYNIPMALNVDDVMPEDCIIAVKEPYYEQTNRGGCIRVDHPSDFLYVSPGSQLIPEPFRPAESLSALQWKDKGNTAYGANKFISALQLYDKAISVIPATISEENISLKRLILRNRAMVKIYLGHFESALGDAKAAMIPLEEAKEPENIKRNTTALYRAGRAAYELHRYSDAEEMFQNVKKLSPQDSDATKEMNKIHERRTEIAGNYDFDSMSKQTSKKHNRLDRADFTSGTAVKAAGAGRGQGLFAAKDFRTGDLVMCEKALGVCFDSDPGSANSYTVLDSTTEKSASDTTAGLLFQLIEKLTKSPSTAAKYFDLDDGGFSQRTTLATIDDVVPVDAFRTLSIIHHNCYGCPTVRSSSNAAQSQLASSKGYPSSGVWMHASRINHACNGNAMRSFMGDMIIVRATRDIKQGEEICMPYRFPHPDNSVTQGELQKIWGFKCDCSLCRVEATTLTRDKKNRAETVGKATEFLSRNKLKEGARVSNQAIDQASKMYERLEKTYDQEKFEGMPRPGLVGLGLWLCGAFAAQKNHAKAIEYSLRTLRDFGFDLKAKGKELEISRDQCLMEPRAVEAAMFAAKSYRLKGETAAAESMRKLAEDFYKILNGELRGFDDRHGTP